MMFKLIDLIGAVGGRPIGTRRRAVRRRRSRALRSFFDAAATAPPRRGARGAFGGGPLLPHLGAGPLLCCGVEPPV